MTTESFDPFVASFLQQVADDDLPPMNALGVAEARQQFEALLPELTGPPEDVAGIENTFAPGPAGEVPVRVYTPKGKAPFPVLVFLHGGGFVIGSLDTYDGICRMLANGAGCVVVSVDYRLAPEHPFPAAVDDSYAATRWVAENADRILGDATRIAVGGDSAGGNLAAVVALVARDSGEPSLAFQLLVYPATDLSSLDTGSYRKYGKIPTALKEDIEWYYRLYLNDAKDALDPLASPLLAPDLGGLPPALLIAAEFDVLLDEGKAYADRLAQAGVPIRYQCCEGMVHACFGWTGIGWSKNGMATAVDGLRSAFAQQTDA